MLSEADLIGFLGTTQPEACRQFYEGLLGLTFVDDEPFTLVFSCNGTILRIGKMEKLTPLPYTVLGWEVRDLDDTLNELERRGGATEFFDGVEQDEKGVATLGDTRIAWLKDPDGNILSLAESSG